MSEWVMDFRGHLGRQIGFLRRSCEAYDTGYTDESIRMATVIRVLLHETTRQTPLLRHMHAMNVKLLSTVPLMSTCTYASMPMMEMHAHAPDRVELVPKLHRASVRWELPAEEWWKQEAHITSTSRLTRRDIVLGAADQDGGAHIDSRLNPQYASLMSEGAVATVRYSRDGEVFAVFNPSEANLVCIRQMAYELLNSPDFLRLSR